MVSQVVIGGILAYSSCVSNPGPNNTINAPELSIRTPKSAQGKSRCLHLCWHIEIHWWEGNMTHRTFSYCFHLVPLISLVISKKTIARSQQDNICHQNKPENHNSFPPAQTQALPNLKRKSMHTSKLALRNKKSLHST